MTDSARPVPVPAKRPIERSHHGDTVLDPYEWLNNPDNPEVIAHLEAENAHTDRCTAHLLPLREELVAEMTARSKETDASVPYRQGDFWYLTRTREGDDYPRYTRVPVALSIEPPIIEGDEPLDGEQLCLDAQALSEGTAFLDIGDMTVSQAGDRFAYSFDMSGGEVFQLRIVEPDTGAIIDEAVRDIGYGLVFSADGRHVFYTRNDDSWRQCELWVHEIGAASEQDRLVLREDDERFRVGIGASRDGSTLLIHIASASTTEALMLPLTEPHASPVSIAGRHDGLDYTVEHAGDHFLIVHNAATPGFEIARAELDELGEGAHERWQRVPAAAPGERIQHVDAFAGHAAIAMRSGGLPALRILPRAEGYGVGWDPGASWSIGHGGELDAVHISRNPEWTATRLRYTVDSLLTPHTTAEIDVTAGPEAQPRILKVTEVPGYRREDYREMRLWVTADDGARVPVSLAARADAQPDGTNPGFLAGYGSYEYSFDPVFSVSWLSLLDRGAVVAIAHVRGGGEMGREWYEQGRLLNKPNTFRDFVTVARELVSAGWFAPGRIAAEGDSAGGLLMGAITNLAPELFRVVHARVPFVDALTTILDPSRPLTVGEWEEWGNPLADSETYHCMKGYSPYENVRAVEYPAIFVTTSRNDVRVSFAEPAKWVARLRETTLNYAGAKREGAVERPILLRCDMAAGHDGGSGRSARRRQRAEGLAFVLDQLGIAARR